METIVIMARALAEAHYLEVIRLDIQYNYDDECCTGYCLLGCSSLNPCNQLEYIIHEDGTITKRED